MRWVPGHSGVGGNVRVDRIARQSRELAARCMSVQRSLVSLENVSCGFASMLELSTRLDGLLTRHIREQKKGRAVRPKTTRHPYGVLDLVYNGQAGDCKQEPYRK